MCRESRAVDLHLFFADLDTDPAVCLNADPVPAAFLNCGSGYSCKIYKKINF